VIDRDTRVFLLVPASSKARVLHPGKVIDVEGTSFVAEFDHAIAPQTGADVLVFAAENSKFVQQAARVAAIRRTHRGDVIGFVRVGEPVPASLRQTYRVSTVAAGILARVDQEAGCPLVDVSAEGFAVATRRQYPAGSIVQVEINHPLMRISAAARVRDIEALPGGRFRHGFLAGDKSSEIRRTLEQFSSAMQRKQLQRRRA
jgi:hypothetical protein